MATRKQNPRATRRTAPRSELKSRDLLLAGVGAVSLGRKQAIRQIEEAGQNMTALRQRFDASVKSIEGRARKLRSKTEADLAKLVKQAEGDFTRLKKQAESRVVSLRKQAKAQVAPLQKKLTAVVGEVREQALQRIDPVLARLGVKAAAKPRRAPAKRPAARKRVRKAA
jgi:hypothetical protein